MAGSVIFSNGYIYTPHETRDGSPRSEGASTADRRWLVADQLGSIVAVTNGAGTATTINSYDAFGGPGPSNAGRFQYTGQAFLPEAALYHYKARAYEPRLGRFLQTDPVGYEDDLNLYAYVGNDPLNKTDPSGLWGYNCAKVGNCDPQDAERNRHAVETTAEIAPVIAEVLAYAEGGQSGRPLFVERCMAEVIFWVLLAATALGAALDAETTRRALSYPMVEEINPVVLFLFKRLPFLVFAIVLIAAASGLSFASKWLMGDLGQVLVAVIIWTAPISNWILLRKLSTRRNLSVERARSAKD